MLDIQLQIFKKVVEKNSFSLAAHELHMTQSAVSQHIHALEGYYCAKLFHRLHRRVCLTEAGTALYPYAVSLEQLYQEARETLSGKVDLVTGRLSISASMTIGEYLLPKIIVQFYKLYPRVRISMNIENTEKVIGKTVDGISDVGFMEGPSNPVSELDWICIPGDDLVIIRPPSYSSDGPAPLKTLLKERWVLQEPDTGTRQVFDDFLIKHGCAPSELNVVISLSNTEAIKSAVISEGGLGIMSRQAVINEIERGELKVIPLYEGTIDRNFWILRNKAKFETRTVERFCSFFLEQVQI